MSAQHAPGPWFARLTRTDELHDGEEPYWLVLAADENANEGDALIASINTLDGADARLIAAAPELLAALAELIGAADETAEFLIDEGWWTTAETLSGFVKKAQAAIAKATGAA